MIGTVIGEEYRVENELGSGAFGVVYECTDLGLERRVALKMLNRASKESKELQRFISEGKILASLNHPNVVHIYRLGELDGTPYIIMELMSGKTLRVLLHETRLPMGRALEILRQVASGLHAIHQKNVVHRDLSANNVMITQDDEAKILDLGLAKDLGRLSTTSKDGYLVGTLAYMSPEQVNGRAVSTASDVFTFGILCYETLSGQHPFAAEHHMSMLYKIAHADARPLASLAQGVPPELNELVQQCLDKDPEARPASMGKVEQTIQRVLDGLTGRRKPSPDLAYSSTLPIGESVPSFRNPYHNRAMIRKHEDFYGRKHEARRIFARFSATPPGSVSIVGERKIGKSSLLNYIYMRKNRLQHLDDPEKMVMVFLDLQEEKQMTIEAFVTILLRMAQLELRSRLDISDIPPSLDGVKQLVSRLHENGFKMGILLDEFDAVTANPNFDLEFFSFLRFLANHYDVAYLTSSMRDLQSLCHTQEISDSPFFNIFSNMRLGVFRQEEAEEFIRVPSEKIGKPLAPYTTRLMEMAGPFPFFLQMACSHTIDYMEENPSRNEPDFDEVRDRFYKEACLHYRYIWGNLDEHEKSALQRVAQGKSVPPSLRHVLQELETRSLVRSKGGDVELFAPTFMEFVMGEAERSSSIFKRWFGRG